jgi:hypothetical protein
MVHSSFSSSSFYLRLVTIISLSLLNPLPFIHGAPTKNTDSNFKLLRQKRQTIYNNDGIMINLGKQEIVFEGLLGSINFFNIKKSILYK